jgi:DegV family protein with EDD domain
MAVKIVTDTVSDLPADLAASLGIKVVPMTVNFGTESLVDGVDISPDQFFERLATAPSLPKTAAPSIEAFAQVYREFTGQGHDVVSMHVSGKLSATLNSAVQAAAEVDSDRIQVVDSQAASLMQALIVTAAARAAQAGGSLEEVTQVARDSVAKTSLYFVLDTLEYLQKGGRIGRAAALVGGLLGIKPILTLHEGEVHPHEKVRTRAKAVARIVEIVQAEGPYEEIAILHASASDDAARLAEVVKPLSTGLPILTSQIGPIVGTYTGPGVIGIAARKA